MILIVISTDSNRTKKSAEGESGENLEQYKSENQTLRLQVSFGPTSDAVVLVIVKVVVTILFDRWRLCRCRWRKKLVWLKNR